MDLLYRVKTLWAALRGNHYTWPAIDITLPGNRHFHLIGSIHMGSHDMAPLPTRLLKKLKNADALIVEADVSTSDTPFANLPACEALEERISEEQLQNLQHISQEMGISPVTLFYPTAVANRDGSSGDAGTKTGAAGRIRYRLPAIAGGEATT